MINFENPVFLLFLIPLTLYLVIRPFPGRAANILQFVINLLLVCALSGMNVKLPDKESVLLILCDRSFSMPSGAEKVMEKQIRRISQQMKNSPGVISFAGDHLVETAPGTGKFTNFKGVLNNRNASDIAGTLNFALGMIPQDVPGRILLISDGNWNGISPESAFSSALMRRIKVDFLPLKRDVFNDFSIAGISAPLSVAPGEYSSLICRIHAPRAALARCRIRKNNGPWQERQIRLKAGENRLLWRDRSENEGVNSYDFQLQPPPGDEIKENNTARHLMEVKGPGKILLLTDSPSGNLGKLLVNARFDIDIIKVPSARVSPETLGSYRAVILENVPASALTPETNALMAELVRQGRLGVFMTGGVSSLGTGGWYKTPVGEVLPAAMEKQNEIRQRRSSLMLALDRSGSMSAEIGGVTKMTMANMAAVESFRLLSPRDEFGLIAVDSSVHEVVPMGEKNQSFDVEGRIMSIESMGGGIFVDKALHEALRQLQKSKAQVRHLLLFADAADAEQPGNYKELLNRAVKAGITVSVVGLGKSDAADAGLLREIAALGGGKCYFVDNAAELPRVFAEDIFVMVRASFRREQIVSHPTADLAALPGIVDITRPFEADGYNLCFAKEKSRILLTAADAEKTPVALTGYSGLGRTAVLGIEVDGEFSGKFSTHPGAGALLTALTRYVIMPRKNHFRECFITQNMDSGIFSTAILLDPERRQVPFAGIPRLSLLITSPGGKVTLKNIPFVWKGPDMLCAEMAVSPGAVVNGAIEFGNGENVPLAPAVHSVIPEFSRELHREIAPLIRLTGGTIKSSFDNIGSGLERQESVFSARIVLLGSSIVLLLLQVWMRRSGKEFPRIRLPRIHWRLPSFRLKPSLRKVRPADEQKETPASSGDRPEKPEQEEFSAALKRAKRR